MAFATSIDETELLDRVRISRAPSRRDAERVARSHVRSFRGMVMRRDEPVVETVVDRYFES